MTLQAQIPATPVDILLMYRMYSGAGYNATLTNGMSISDAQPMINGDLEGEGTPGDIVRLYDGSSLIGSTVITAAGW
jgi:hypothetical protein